jgi:crossover junction endodeoxyribonuclease RuvC
VSVVLGLDLSLAATGVAVSRGAGPIVTETIETTGKKGDGYPVREQRMRRVLSLVASSVPFDVDLVVIEAPAYAANLPGAWDRAGVWWATVMGIRDLGHPIALVPPANRAQYATGKGGANKVTVMAAAMRTYTQAVIHNDNEADAVVLTAMGQHWLGAPLAAVPPRHATAIDGCLWPSRDLIR